MSVMHPIDPSNTNNLGRDLRALRKSRGLTLSQLAELSNRSVGFISQIERGISDPSINDLRSLAKILNVPLSLLFMSENPDPVERGFIVRKGARRSLGTKIDGIVEELLSPDLGGSFEMFRSVIEPFTEQVEPVLRQTEEAGYIVQGQIDLWVGEQKFNLNTGDSFRFDHKPCRWHNKGDIQAIIIWVVSPPVY